MFNPGDIVAFHSTVAGKRKYHLCISLNGHFLFLNSPKARNFPGDFIIDNAELPNLPETPTGESVVSCNMVVTITKGQLRSGHARRIGTASREQLLRLLEFIENTTVLSNEDKYKVLDGLGNWL